MKKYYLFLIILLALKCSIIAQKVEPSRTYNLIEKCYCTSFKQGEKLYNGTIVYVCTKCGKETMANPNGVGGTIEDIIEQNKREAKLAELMKNPSQASNAEAAKMLGTIVPSTITKQQEEAIKKIQKSQNVSNQQKPTTTSKPQGKTTSKPSTTTKKQQTNLDIPSVNRSSSEVAVKQPKPTVEENLGKISDGIDAAIDMVKKISNKDGTNNTTLKENYNPIQERALKKFNNPLNPVCDPNKEYIVTHDDLRELASIMKKEYSDEAESHFGRDVASLKPYSLDEVIYELENGSSSSIAIDIADQYHQDDETNTFSKDPAIMKEIIFGGLGGAVVGGTLGGALCGSRCAVFGGVAGAGAVADKVTLINDPKRALGYLDEMKKKGIENVKITMSGGREAVYNLDTGKIVMNEKLGTQNFGERGVVSSTFGNHKKKDIDPNNTKAIEGNQFTRDGDQYKYVGILYERDKKYPDRYYIINGQTGERMTAKQAYEFATTVSDMYVDDSPYQSVIDPLDPKYEEHLNYHKNQNSVFGK